MDNTIKCPNCGAEIEISEALKHQLEESVRAEEREKARREAGREVEEERARNKN